MCILFSCLFLFFILILFPNFQILFQPFDPQMRTPMKGWKNYHLEVASDSFCFLINSSWLLVFILYVFSLSLSGFNLYCWKGIHFSYNNFLIFLCLFFMFIISFHFWFRDLLRELNKKYEILLMVLFLVFFLFLAS